MQKDATPSPTQPRRKRKFDARSYRRRIKAAGLDNDTVPEDAVAFRLALARRIWMLLDEWHGCPELVCQRNRGCMAPHNFCANMPPSSEEEINQEWAAVRTDLLRSLKNHLIAHGGHDE